MRATAIVIYLDTRRQKTDGTYPVKIKITHRRQRKYYPSGLNMSEEEFSKLETPRYRRENKLLTRMKNRAIEIADNMEIFEFEKFEELYLQQEETGPDNTDEVTKLYQEQISLMETQGRIGTAKSYKDSLQSLVAFKKDLRLREVTVQFLEEYESHMLEIGKSETTIGMYLRVLRAIYNLAVDRSIISRDLYPFGRRKYTIPAPRNVKKALNLEDIKKIIAYEPKQVASPKGGRKIAAETIAFSRDMWLFMYLTNGLNVQDLVRLRYKDISENRVTFRRTKTKRTTKGKDQNIVAVLTPEALQIIERWGDKSKVGYIFPVLNEFMSAKRERAVVSQFTKNINKHMGIIAKALGIEKEVTTYTARHSFASRLNEAGVPLTYISEALGHHSTTTTLVYLKTFEDKAKVAYSNLLTGE